ncbi:hypothetical protein GBA63_01140 [Rubrobacter tropicus]|uniref:DUF4352 domain-containing protein n=1 Tax=Rubrobacter tropicus TaxID=2653851 RepID=A0A6G8Q4K9_9ACTN|nr:DUF4352 domain-containing protein [Rubrobacter tropicus]QIN81383.1 hypothetical protein GBA63_01140 [Rubrobacter tropicus]
MTSQTAIRETEDLSGAVSPTVPRYRAVAGALILAFAVAAALVAGGWGLVSSLTGEEPPARVGEDVKVPGGLLRVEKVTPEHMAPMQTSKFSAGGMNMSSTGMDMAPEGYERFAVEVTLVSRGGLEYAPEDFRLSGKGVKDHQPIRSQLGEDNLAGGNAVAGNLVFQAPEKAENLMLRFDGGRAVALDLPAGEGGGHGH